MESPSSSTWTIVSGSFSPTPTVERWGSIEPSTTTRSHVASHSWTGFSPQMRRPNTWPRDSGWSSGKAPLAPSEVTTGAPNASARVTISSVPPSICTSSPTRMAGRFACRSSCRACSTRAGSPLGTAASLAPSISTSAWAASRSVGISSSIGRGRRVWNRWKASIKWSGMDSTSLIMAFQSVTASNILNWSLVSWVTIFP